MTSDRTGGFLQRVLQLARDTTDAGERHWLWLIGFSSALYLFVVIRIAAGKPLENDELFTLYMSRLPTLADIQIGRASCRERV